MPNLRKITTSERSVLENLSVSVSQETHDLETVLMHFTQMRVNHKQSSVDFRNVPPGSAGDTFFLYYWVKGVDIQRKRDFKVLLKPTAADGSNEKISCKLTKKKTFDYEQMMCPFEPSIDYEYVTLTFDFVGSQGAIYLDRLDLFQELA